MLSRRAFFRRATFAATALAIADDPDRLLWTPRARTISIPALRYPYGYTHADFEVWANQCRMADLRFHQNALNYVIWAQMESIRYMPVALIGRVQTVSLEWTDADFPNS